MDSKVTIAIPTYNRAAYFRIALDSALAQTYSNLEIVVSNNACTDDTAGVLASIDDPRMRAVMQPSTVGMMENWNACLNAASGKYFLLLSDDDILEPTAIAEMVDALEDSARRGNEVGFVWCAAKTIDCDGKELPIKDEPSLLGSAKELILTLFEGKRDLRFYPCGILFRKDDLAPGYDLRYPLAADAAQWIRAVIKYGSARYVNRNLVRYRLHQNTTLRTRPDVWCKEFSALAEFAIGELRTNGYAGWDFSGDIRGTEQTRNVRITIGMIKLSLRDRKLQALSEYWRNYRMFTSFFGLVSLIKGVLIVIMPKSLESWLRRSMAPMSKP
jgi:glycosyltransferase involved in cell wall biosynthesis